MIKACCFLTVVVLAVIVAAMVGCGGGGSGGGGGGGGGGQSAGVVPGQYVEFLTSSGATIDPYNLTVGATGTVLIANYDALGNRTVLSSSSWAVNVNPQYVSVNSVTGAFQVIASPGTYFYFSGQTLIAGNPTTFLEYARVPTETASVNGRVVEFGAFTGQLTDYGVPFLVVEFFTGSGEKVGSARTGLTGYFSARVPLTATVMMINSDSIRTFRYYRSVWYLGTYYAPLDIACRIPLGTLSNGTNTIGAWMGMPLVSGGPPPPPGGCS